jgi:hypothetical protein
MSAQPHKAHIRFYSDDLLPNLQHTLAALADIETRYEIERDHLARWAGSGEEKDRLLAELEQCYRANRERLVACLEGLRQGRVFEPAPRGEPVTDKRIDTFEP